MPTTERFQWETLALPMMPSSGGHQTAIRPAERSDSARRARVSCASLALCMHFGYAFVHPVYCGVVEGHFCCCAHSACLRMFLPCFFSVRVGHFCVSSRNRNVVAEKKAQKERQFSFFFFFFILCEGILLYQRVHLIIQWPCRPRTLSRVG